MATIGSPKKTLRLGTRGSRLAMRQSETIAAALKALHPGLEIELLIIQSTGDQLLNSPLWQIGGKGLFTREIEVALLENRIDLAVHSLKDLPTANTPGLTISAIPPRESPWDLLLAAEPVDLATLSAAEVVGTSSLRRQALLRSCYPQLTLEDLRGNVPTRLAKMLDGEYRAIILAEAGIHRLELNAPYVRRLTEKELLPAPGQGALGVQTREHDQSTCLLVAALNHPLTAACTTAERALLHHLGGGCQAPLGAIARVQGAGLHLTGRVVSKDCTEQIEFTAEGSLFNPDDLGKTVADAMLKKGAAEWMSDWRVIPNQENNPIVLNFEAEQRRMPLYNFPVVVTREEDADGPVSRALRNAGASPLCLPLVESILQPNTPEMKRALSKITSFDWVVLTSKRAFEALLQGGLDPKTMISTGVRWACVGEGTSERLLHYGLRADLQAANSSAEGLALSLVETLGANAPGTNVFFPRSNISGPVLPELLRKAGVLLEEVVAYETHPATTHHETLSRLLASHQARCVLFCSPSAVESFASAWELIPEAIRFELAGYLILGSIGPSTTAALKILRLKPSFETPLRTFDGLVQALIHHVSHAPTKPQ